MLGRSSLTDVSRWKSAVYFVGQLLLVPMAAIYSSEFSGVSSRSPMVLQVLDRGGLLLFAAGIVAGLVFAVRAFAHLAGDLRLVVASVIVTTLGIVMRVIACASLVLHIVGAEAFSEVGIWFKLVLWLAVSLALTWGSFVLIWKERR